MTRLLPFLAVFGLIFLPGCGSDEAADQAGFETPEKAFEAFQKAGAANDFPGVVRCLSPESVDAMAPMILFPLAMIAAFDSE